MKGPLYLRGMKGEKTVKISGEIAKELKKFVAENGGTIKSAMQIGALWVMSKGAKEYLNSLKK